MKNWIVIAINIPTLVKLINSLGTEYPRLYYSYREDRQYSQILLPEQNPPISGL